MPLQTAPPTTAELLEATTRALALLAHAVGHRVKANPVLHDMARNHQPASTPGADAALDDMVAAMMLALSSLAVKQDPEDQEAAAIYRQLRDGTRH